MKLKEFFNNLRAWFKKYGRLILLVVTCLLILAVVFFQYTAKPLDTKNENTAESKLTVDAIKIGDAAVYTRTIAQAENRNEVEVAGLSTGYLSELNIKEGDKVSKGKVVAEISETYRGNSFYSIQVEIAQKGVEQSELQLKNIESVYADKVTMAESQYTEANELLKLNNEKLKDLRTQILATEDIIEDVEDIIEDYRDFEDEIEDNVPDGFEQEQLLLQNNTAILGQTQSLQQYSTTLEQLQQQEQLLEFQTKSDYPGGVINQANKDIYLKQLENEKKIAELGVESAKVQLELQEAQAALRSVYIPFDGVVEQVYVKEGQVITPGQPIALISGDIEMKLIANISSDVVKQLDQDEKAVVILDGETYKVDIEYISITTIEDSLHQLILEPNNSLVKNLTVGSSVEVEIPLKTQVNEEDDRLFIPLDSVFKSSTSEFVLIYKDGVAVKRDIETGEIVGNQIFVKSGIEKDEILITDRRVIAGQQIVLNNPDLIEPEPEEENEKDTDDEEENEESEEQDDSEVEEEINQQND